MTLWIDRATGMVELEEDRIERETREEAEYMAKADHSNEEDIPF